MTIGHRVTVPYRVSFGDTDASGRIHWGAVFRIFEQAERELWRSLNAMDMYGYIPRAHVEADYLASMAFDDELRVEASIEGIGRTSARVGFRAERNGEDVARGHAVVVWVDEQGTPRPIAARLSSTTANEQGNV